jgi:hypothetical protein
MVFEKDYDVVIAGAGVAGVAAALTCARAGMRTALLEKTVLVGGLATTGLVNYYLPLCDGRGHQVIYGISEELLHLSIKYGPGRVPADWREKGRYSTPFSPASFVLALDEVLLDAGVDLWLDTLVSEPILSGPRLTGIVVENKSGRGLLKARCTIDATGDADVAYRAGAPCAQGDNWLSLWALQTSLVRAQRASQRAAEDRAASLLEGVRVGGDANGRGHPEGHRTYHGTEGAEVTDFVLEGRRLLREHYQVKQTEIGPAGRHQCFPVTLPAMAQFRTTRRIDGIETMMAEQENIEIPTSVGVIPDWRESGPLREIPYGALLPQGVQGLLAIGRCMSAAGEAWEVARVIPPAALTGEIAGIASQLALARGTTPDALDVADVQAAVRDRGLPLHISDIVRQASITS